MIKAVIDTNVLVSGLLRAHPAAHPAQVIDAWEANRFALLISNHILRETERTLSAPYFRQRLTTEQVVRAQLLLRRRAALTEITADVQGVATHPEDDLILATAVSGTADYLVTGDRQLQKLGTYDGVQIVSPREFIAILGIEQTKGDEL